MKLTRFALAAGLCITATAMAGPQLNPNGLVPRQALSKTPTEQLQVRELATGRVVVKFRDQDRMRPLGNGKVDSMLATRAAAVASIENIRAEFAVTFSSMFEQSQAQLDEITRRLNDRGFEAPDFGGMMVVSGFTSDEDMLAFMQQLNEQESVEYLYDEIPITQGDAPIGALTSRVRQWSPFYTGDNLNKSLMVHAQGPLVDATNAALGLSRSVVAEIELPENSAGFQAKIPLDGEVVTLALARHSVVTDDFQMLEATGNGTYRPVKIGLIETVRGTIVGEDGSEVAGAVLPEGLLLGIRHADGSFTRVEPIAGKVPGAVPGMHAIFSAGDASCTGTFGSDGGVLLPAGFVPPSNRLDGNGGLQPTGPGTAVRAQIALDLDHHWVEQCGSLYLAAVRAVATVDVVNLQFFTQVNIYHVVSAIVVRPTAGSDPYTTSNPAALLDQVENEWNTNLSFVTRDLAHLLTGRNLDGTDVGYSVVFGMCNTDPDTGDPVSYGLTQYIENFACQTDILAHELGHSWGATNSQLDGFTMSPNLSCANFFSPFDSIPQIESYRDYLVDEVGCVGVGSGAGCGTGTSCFIPHGTPYCADLVCCGIVCAMESFCCETAWDALCVDLANEFCTGCGQANAGSCFSANNTPGCEDGDCCSLVIAALPHCADFWDDECAMYALVAPMLTGNFDCFTDTQGPTPDLKGFQAYLTPQSSLTFAAISGGAGGEGLDLAYLDELGQNLLEQGLGEVDGSKGAGIRVAVLEDAAYVPFAGNEGHEDLTHVTSEPGQILLLDPFLTEPDHGTATLGIIAAEDNGFGMTGIAYEATPYFFPTWSVNSGTRTPSAIMSAMLTFGPGDVFNFSIGPVSAMGRDCTPGSGVLTSQAGIYTLIRAASDLGITSCISAGNDCCNLDSSPEAGDDSGAIIVAACEAGFPYCRLAFSNHSATCPPAIPHVSAWGTSVATCGYGELWPNADPNRQYTAQFGGTSAAAPMVAGCVARLQGLTRQLYGISLSPEQVRSGITGLEQCQLTSGQCGPDMLGNDDVNADACDGDVWAQDPENPGDPMGVPNYIGVFPSTADWASNLLTQSAFDGSPLLEDIYVIGGTLLYGNDNSVRSLDGNYLVVESRNVSQGDSPAGDGSDSELPEADQAFYLGNGAITDVVAVFRADIDDVQAMATTYCLQMPTTFQLVFVESWDYEFRRWEFIDVAILPVEVPCLVSQPPKAAEYVNDEGRILVRYWTFGFVGQTGFGSAFYRTRWDLLDLDVSAQFGEQLP